NLALNPDLARRVTAIQSFVADRDASRSSLLAYSSWPIAGEPARGQHPIHKGVIKATSCGQVKLDTLLERFPIQSAPLTKIHTDGHEFSVLSGATTCLML